MAASSVAIMNNGRIRNDGNSGIYSFYFDNQEYSSKKTVHASFRSPYEPSINRFEVLGLSLMFVGLAILIYSTRELWAKKRT